MTAYNVPFPGVIREPLTAKLLRGDAAGWQAYRSTEGGALAVFVRCPFCGQVNSLGENVIEADGQARYPLRCPQPGCLVITYRVLLQGWTFSEVRHPGVLARALCQRDDVGY